MVTRKIFGRTFFLCDASWAILSEARQQIASVDRSFTITQVSTFMPALGPEQAATWDIIPFLMPRWRSVFLWIARFLFASFGVLAAAKSAPAVNVVVITIDTLRADHLGCYGYKLIRTPHIDALASESVRFERAYTPVPVTL